MNPNLTAPSITIKDLLLKKLYCSVVCSVVSQLVLLQIYVVLVNFNIFDIETWVLSTLSTFTSISTWLFVIPFLTIIFAQSVICAKDYVLQPSFCSTRFQKFISVFSLHNLVLLVLNIVVGATLIWLLLSLGSGRYQNIVYECKGPNYCLNEGSFFLILGGFWTGLYYFVKVYISEKHLSFPVIHQRKVFQLKSQAVPLLKESFSLSGWPSIYFVLLYTLWGDNLAEGLRVTLGLLRDENTTGHLIYLYLWMFGAIYYFNMSLMHFFFNLFLTEPVEFPLYKETPDSLWLQDVINTSNVPIAQNLACLDLYNLAQWSKPRRQVFFTLSQPGGHPHNWNSLVENVLKLFKEYTELLSKATETTEATKLPAPPTTMQNIFQSPDRFRNLRNMSLPPDRGMMDIVDVTHEPLPGFLLPGMIKEKLKQKLLNGLSVVKVVFGINFLFGELPQANIQKCLANGYIIIWTSQGISDLVCASLVEDRFGIVQKDLPGIITSLVQLKQSLDKLNKVPALTRKVAGHDDFNFRMKGAMTMAVKRSLFNIYRTFGSYLNDFPLSKDVVLYMQSLYKS